MVTMVVVKMMFMVVGLVVEFAMVLDLVMVVSFVVRIVCVGCGNNLCCGGFDNCGAGCVGD
jgi:hypothetical protein